MTDQELIARLLDWEEYDEGKINDAREDAADRIEALIAENEQLEARLGEHNLLWQAYNGDLHQAYVDANEARIDAEANLAKAVEALDMLVRDCEADYPPSHGAIKHFAIATLAELKAYDHD